MNSQRMFRAVVAFPLALKQSNFVKFNVMDELWRLLTPRLKIKCNSYR